MTTNFKSVPEKRTQNTHTHNMAYLQGQLDKAEPPYKNEGRLRGEAQLRLRKQWDHPSTNPRPSCPSMIIPPPVYPSSSPTCPPPITSNPHPTHIQHTSNTHPTHIQHTPFSKGIFDLYTKMAYTCSLRTNTFKFKYI